MAQEPPDASRDFSTAPSKPHEHSSEGPAYSYTTNGPFKNVGETGDSGLGQKPFPPKMDAKLFGGFRDPGNPFAAVFGQNRAFHQDHSSVGGLTAEDIDKARQAKTEQKPYKQMVCVCFCVCIFFIIRGSRYCSGLSISHLLLGFYFFCSF